jgi:acetyl/propionyl-CoA carboxylase alpha subunit
VKDSYLNVEALMHAIRSTRADAVHPGYGLLSENAAFRERVALEGAVFIGPGKEALEAFGDKITARAVARSAGVEPPPGSDGVVDPQDADTVRAEAERIGFPVLIKAAGGGGGIGMQIVTAPDQLAKAARTCADRGRAAFGDARVYIERYLSRPRHIEVQVFRDSHGNSVALGERECSVQRRHQKIVEEAPSPAAFFTGEEGAARRERLFDAARRIVERVGYLGAGTVEFEANEEGELYFLEVNARLQVEHPVTELVTGLDLVELQLLVASESALPAAALSVRPSGHAIEARIYAEDPAKGFIPQPGRLTALAWPEHDGVRIDSGVEAGSEVTPYYDPMIAKVIAHAADRAAAIERLDRALESTVLELEGPKGPRSTNLGFLRQVLASERFRMGAYDTGLAEVLARGE